MNHGPLLTSGAEQSRDRAANRLPMVNADPFGYYSNNQRLWKRDGQGEKRCATAP